MKKPDNTLALDAYKRLLEQQEADARKAGRGKKLSHEESELQRSCVKYFRAQYPEHALMLFAVPNGGRREKTEAKIMKAEGVTAGVADLILLEARGGYGALCIEMKTTKKGSRQEASQRKWEQATEKAGNAYIIVRDLDTFMEEVDWYMGQPLLTEATYKAPDLSFLGLQKYPVNGWKDVLKELPEPGTVCSVKLMYDTYEATWDGHDWIDVTGFRLLGVVGWMPKETVVCSPASR